MLIPVDIPQTHSINDHRIPGIVRENDTELAQSLEGRLAKLGLSVTNSVSQTVGLPDDEGTSSHSVFFSDVETKLDPSEPEKGITSIRNTDYETLTEEGKLIVIDDLIGHCLAFENSDPRVKLFYAAYLRKYLSTYDNLPITLEQFKSDVLIDILAKERMKILGLPFEEDESMELQDSSGLGQIYQGSEGYGFMVSSPLQNVTISKVFFSFESYGLILLPIQNRRMAVVGTVNELEPEKRGKSETYFSLTLVFDVNTPFTLDFGTDLISFDINERSPQEMERPDTEDSRESGKIEVGRVIVFLSNGSYYLLTP